MSTSPRPRAQSEALPHLPSGRWRLVGAWSSFRRSLHTDAPTATPSGITPGRRDSTADTPRRRISLFLKRRPGSPLRRARSGLPFTYGECGGVARGERAGDADGAMGDGEDVEEEVEIRLEDFAEGDEGEDWSVDLDGLSRRGSVRVDGVVLGEEDVKKLLEMGVEEWVEEHPLDVFDVEELGEEWRRCGEEHNRVCGRWNVGQGDVREFLGEWEGRRGLG